MTIGDRGPAGRADRVRSAYYGGDPDDGGDRDWERPASGGLTRILVVVILLHVAGIAGVLGYRWVHRDGGETPGAKPVSSQADPEPVDKIVPEPRTNGKAIVVDHPTLKGHIRYRVGKDEQLLDVARRFNASVPEVESLNSLRSGTPLYIGQWLTVPDRRQELSGRGTEPEPVKPTPKPGQDDAAPAPVAVPISNPGPRISPTPVITAPEPVKPPAPPVIQPPAPLPQPVPAPVVRDIVASGQTYKVNPGDTAYRIAQRYGVTPEELLQFNGLSDPRKLQAGQVLKIPAKR